MSYKYQFGDYLVTCARSGQKRLRSECVKEWTGQIVAREYAEPRHPLDLERAPRAERSPRETQPMPDPVFLSPGDVTPDSL